MVHEHDTRQRYDEETSKPDAEPDTGTSVRTHNKENALLRWVLLDGDRPTIVVSLSVAVFAGFFLLGWVDVLGVTAASPVTGAFTAAITGVFALVTITVSMNQLVLSRVVGSPGHIEERIDSVHRFRDEVESMNAHIAVSPTDPARFLEVVAGSLRSHTLELQERYDERHDRQTQEEVDELIVTLLGLATHIEHHIESDTSDLYRILSPILNNSYSSHINTLSRIRATTETLDDEEREALTTLAETLEVINLTRHYFKTLYIHEELATVSRHILVTGMPAAVGSFAMILMYADGAATAVGEVTLLAMVSGAIALVFVPLSILFAYGIRLATVAKRTTTFGTFTPAQEMP